LLYLFDLDRNGLIYHQGVRQQKLINDRQARVVANILA